jgi:hypothetical protein
MTGVPQTATLKRAFTAPTLLENDAYRFLAVATPISTTNVLKPVMTVI